MSVRTRSGQSKTILVGATFGALLSTDGGCSFRWLCEQSVGYGGTFDPKYHVADDGTIFATTYAGLRISRDQGCTFTTATAETPAGSAGRIAEMWVDALALGSNGLVWVATAESGQPNDLYRSTDQGRTFTPMGLRSSTVWYKSLALAGPDHQRVWATGYQIAGPNGAPPEAFVFRSDNGGAQWHTLALAGFAWGPTPIALLAAVDNATGTRAFVTSVYANPPNGDILYRTDDAGATWREVLRTTEPIRDVVIAAGDRVWVATNTSGLWRSDNGGQQFAPHTPTPRANCLAVAEDGSLIACGANWAPDQFALGKSSDGLAWQKLVRFSELAGPVACPPGTPQHDLCEAQVWPSLREQFGVVGPTVCAGPSEAPPRDGAPIAPAKTGCCQSGEPAAGAAWAGVALGLLQRRRSRRVSQRKRC